MTPGAPSALPVLTLRTRAWGRSAKQYFRVKHAVHGEIAGIGCFACDFAAVASTRGKDCPMDAIKEVLLI